MQLRRGAKAAARRHWKQKQLHFLESIENATHVQRELETTGTICSGERLDDGAILVSHTVDREEELGRSDCIRAISQVRRSQKYLGPADLTDRTDAVRTAQFFFPIN